MILDSTAGQSRRSQRTLRCGSIAAWSGVTAITMKLDAALADFKFEDA